MRELLGSLGQPDPETGEMLGELTIEKVLEVSASETFGLAWGGSIAQKRGDTLRGFSFPADFGLFLVVKGELSLLIDDQPHHVDEGQVLLVWPGEQCVSAGPNDRDLICLWLSFRIDRSRRGRPKEHIQVPRLVTSSSPERVAEKFRLLTEEYHESNAQKVSPTAVRSLSVKFLLLSLLAKLAESSTADPECTGAMVPLAERGRDYLRIHYGESISTEDVAAALDCSPTYLRKAFRCTYGQSPTRYLLAIRLRKARQLLEETRLPMSQVAVQSGFSNQNYFTRVFKQNDGVTPARYRSLHSRSYAVRDI